MELMITAALQLGTGGLFGVMWWIERATRIKAEGERDTSEEREERSRAREIALINVVKANTRAISRLETKLDAFVARGEAAS